MFPSPRHAFTKSILLLLVLFASTTVKKLSAQSLQAGLELPQWVQMIDNPNTNYYEAIRLFKDFWKDKPRPEGPEDEGFWTEEEKQRHAKFELQRTRMSDAERNYWDLLKYHYKRFENWEKEIKPFVLEDGRILSMEERQAIWYKQQKELSDSKK